MTPNPEVQERIRRYLLGQLNDRARQEIEQQLILDENLFEELLVAEDEIIDAYLNGKLNADDRGAFERHFLATPERQEKLKFGRSFNRYLSSQAPAPVRQRKPPHPWAWTQDLFSTPLRIAACAIVLLALAVGLWRVFFYQSEVD